MNNKYHQIANWLYGTLLVFVASVTFAATGFIANSRVSDVESGDDSSAEINIGFNCKAEYLRHEPQSKGDRLRIYLEPTGICNGVSPLVAESRIRLRPFNADRARLVELEYDGTTTVGGVLTLTFSEPVNFDVDMAAIAFDVAVRVSDLIEPLASADDAAVAPTAAHRQVIRPQEEALDWVINLASFRRIPTVADAPGLQLAADQRLYYTEVLIDGTTWYRLRLGNFESAGIANNALAELKQSFSGAWIDKVDSRNVPTELLAVMRESSPVPDKRADDDTGTTSKVDALMEEARKTVIAGDTSRAIQIYTKILQLPEHPRHP